MSLIAGIVLAAAASCAPTDAQDLHGRWESRATSRGGIGETLDLRRDGSFVQSTVVLVNMRYEVRGNELVLHEAKSDNTKESHGTPFRITGNLLIRGAGVAQEVRAERIDTPERNQAPIVGAWKYRHYTGVMAYERYGPDGEVMLRLPMKSVVGCFAADPAKGEIVFSPAAGGRSAAAYAVEGATLRITPSGRSPNEYRRGPWGAWYDIDHIDYRPPPRTP